MRRRFQWMTALLALLSGFTAVPGAAVPARAQDPPQPAIVDGFYFTLLTISGPIGIGVMDARVYYSGLGMLTASEGVLAGDWTMGGTADFSGPDMSGTASYLYDGAWEGTAARLLMRGEGGTAEGTMTVGDMTLPLSQPLPASDPVEIPLIMATCEQFVGNVEWVANTMLAEAGTSPALTGTLVGYRSAADPEGSGGAYADSALELMTQGLVFMVDSSDAGAVDFARLNDLMTRAEDLYDALERSAECGGDRAADAWLGLLAGMVYDLLTWATDNPDLVDDAALLRLMAAGVRMGLWSSESAPGPELVSRLSAQITARAILADAERSCTAALNLALAASLLGDEATTAVVNAALSGACGG